MFLHLKGEYEPIPVEVSPKMVSEAANFERQWEAQATEDNTAIVLRFTEQPYGFLKNYEVSPAEKIDLDYLERQIESFLEQVAEQMKDGIEDDTDTTSTPPIPYDPRQIRITNERWSISFIMELIDKYKSLELNPDFQRSFVWDNRRKSQLIESLMLGIPLPAFYFSETEKGTYQVVDGLQRITTIHNFMHNEFSLRYLEYLNKNNTSGLNQEGLWFETDERKKGIDGIYKMQILKTQLSINIIEKSSPSKVKFDVFRRVNTGGKPLNSQEIRNCLSNNAVRQFINDLARSPEFEKATNYSIKNIRMEAQELVLRFIAFWHVQFYDTKKLEYKGDMQSFLDEMIDILNKEKNMAYFDAIKIDFKRAMDNCFYLFGKYAFRKCLPQHLEPNSRQQVINKSLFTVWTLLTCKYSTEHFKTIEEGAFAYIFAQALENNRDYSDAFSNRTNDRSVLTFATQTSENLLNQHFTTIQ